MHWKLTRWQQAMASHELCITAGQMSESLRKYPPFDEFPAPNAGRITILNRSLGLVGDETWARFEFAREQDFKAYMQSVTSHPLVAEDAKMAFDYEMRLGPILARLMKQDLATSGVRATMPGLPSKQWIFLPQQRRVLSTCTD